MKHFPAYLKRLSAEDERALKPCRKKPIVIKATQVNERFRVNTPEGTTRQGEAGDYLLCGVEDELYHCSQSVFEKSYDWIEQLHDEGDLVNE